MRCDLVGSHSCPQPVMSDSSVFGIRSRSNLSFNTRHDITAYNKHWPPPPLKLDEINMPRIITGIRVSHSFECIMLPWELKVVIKWRFTFLFKIIKVKHSQILQWRVKIVAMIVLHEQVYSQKRTNSIRYHCALLTPFLLRETLHECQLNHIYIHAFSRCFYPKQLIVHSGYTFLSVCVFPGNQTHNLCAANTML